MFLLMLFPTSGRCGFDRLQWREPGAPPIAREALKTLLIMERDVRLSAECQQRFTDAYERGGDIAAVSEWAQETALKACGYEPTEHNLLMLRSALSLYPDVRLFVIGTTSLIVLVSCAGRGDSANSVLQCLQPCQAWRSQSRTYTLSMIFF